MVVYAYGAVLRRTPKAAGRITPRNTSNLSPVIGHEGMMVLGTWALVLVLATATDAAGLKYNAWFGTRGGSGPFLGNATNAAAAGYRQFAGGGIAMVATLDAVPGGPWYNDTEMKAVASARAALEADVAAAHDAGLEYATDP